MESPILPPFWDHFNPGLALLAPSWWLIPRVELIFFLHALCLSGAALLIAAIARAHGQTTLCALLWGGAWLLSPIVGQWNLAYTYGWHPIIMAIPALLGSYWCLIRRHRILAIAFAILAVSFEEGVLVAVTCFACARALQGWIESRGGTSHHAVHVSALAWPTWCGVALVSGVMFVMIYQFSGLAEFQTARFARLGSGPLEIVLAPILKPAEFWGLLFRERNLPFVCFVFAPFLACMVRSGWWYVLAIAPPMGVLLVWEHLPAQSIAFQYTCCVIPILFLGAMSVPSPVPTVVDTDEPGFAQTAASTRRGLGLASTFWVLSIFIGQLPWSGETLIDVQAKAYGPEFFKVRFPGGDDQRWMQKQIAELIEGRFTAVGNTLPALPSLRVLATGRIASHFVGANDLETVGQFWQRYTALQSLTPDEHSPLLRYDVIILDSQEAFQQTWEETQRVQREALASGFRVAASAHGIAVLIRPMP